MAAFRAVAPTIAEITPGAGVGLSVGGGFPSVGGTPVAGDSIYHVLVVPNNTKASYTSLDSMTQIGSWVIGEADSYGVPALGLFTAPYTTAVAFDWQYNQDSLRGAGIYAFAYSGDTTVRQVVTGTNTASSSLRSGPAITAQSGNMILACMGGSASAATLTWGGGFTERGEDEYYGINSAADLAGDGSSKTPTVTPTASTQSMWLLVEMGAVEKQSFYGSRRRRVGGRRR